jgi:UDPglucose 6-dehydrogenase
MKVAVFGAGYVGLVTGACISDFGNTVFCVDNIPEKVAKLKKGEIPIYEPGLDEIIKKNVGAGRLFFTIEAEIAIKEAEIIFIAVGTPPKKDGSADISSVEAVAKIVGEVIKKEDGKDKTFRVIINKSTVPVGMGQRVRQILDETGVSKEAIGIVSNPEFLREGSALGDFFRPDRVVLGSDSQKAIDLVKELYRPLNLIETPFVETNLETAELIKYASNAFLATKISFINEIANICDRVGADVHMVSMGMGRDTRIGKYFLHPGPGYGGSCFPKDTSALVSIAKNAGYDLQIVKTVEKVNAMQKKVMVEKIKAVYGDDLTGKTFGMLGLAFKPNTDDMREAPAITIIEELLKLGAKIKAFDPEAMGTTKDIIGDKIEYSSGIFETLENADALILVTEWNDFRNLDLKRAKECLKEPVIFDARNVFQPDEVKALGFKYIGMGRG